MNSRHLGIATATLLTLGARVGQTEVPLPGATLVVHNPPERADCVSEGQLQVSILSQLSLATASSSPVKSRRFEVSISEEGTNLIAELRVTGEATGLRRIESNRCPGLADALAVTLALILEGTEQPIAPPPTAEPQIPPARRPPAPPEPRRVSKVFITNGQVTPRAVATPKPLQIRLDESLETRAWLGTGLGTQGNWHLESGLGLTTRHWGLGVGAYWDPTHEISFGGVDVRVMNLGGLVAGCWHMGTQWRPMLCVRGAAGGERVAGTGRGDVKASILPVIHVGPSVGIETGTRWVFGLDLIGQASPWRDVYVVGTTADADNQKSAPLITAWLVARVALTSHQSHD